MKIIEFIKLVPSVMEAEIEAMKDVAHEAPGDRAARRASEARQEAAARSARERSEAAKYEADTIKHKERCEQLITQDALCGDDGATLSPQQEKLIVRLFDKLLKSEVLLESESDSSQVSLQRFLFLVYDLAPNGEVLPHALFFKGWLRIPGEPSPVEREPSQVFKEWVTRSVARAYATALTELIEETYKDITIENGLVKGIYENSRRSVRQSTSGGEASSSAGVTAEQLQHQAARAEQSASEE